MISPVEISAGLTSLRTAFDIAKAIKGITDAADRNVKILELQGVIIEAQNSAIAAQQVHASDVKRIEALEAEVARMKAWDGEKARYELKAIGNGAFVYAVKPGMENGEPPHWLCPPCYTKGQKSFLQRTSEAFGQRPSERTWDCPFCRGKLAISYKRSPSNPEGL